MWPDQVSHPGPLSLESDLPPTALLGPAYTYGHRLFEDRTSRKNGVHVTGEEKIVARTGLEPRAPCYP